MNMNILFMYLSNEKSIGTLRKKRMATMDSGIKLKYVSPDVIICKGERK